MLLEMDRKRTVEREMLGIEVVRVEMTQGIDKSDQEEWRDRKRRMILGMLKL